MNRFYKFVACISFIVLLAGCAEGPKDTEEMADQPVVASGEKQQAKETGFDWHINLMQYEITGHMSSTQAILQYGGDVDKVDYDTTPAPGKQFLLVELTIQKNVTGPNTFEWDHLYVTDGAGNKFSRYENDLFIEQHGLPRIKSTNLTFGNNKGFICFEIPEDTNKALTLVYEMNNSEQKIQIIP